MINPLWLQSLCKVVETGSFTRAAEALNLTQAAVSQHLARLEAEAGVLLLRHTRQLELTPRGQAMLAYAQEVQAAEYRLRQQLADDGPLQGAVRLATPGSLGLKLYPALLDLQQQHLGIVIELRFAPGPAIVQAVLDQTVEIGVTTLAPTHPQLHSELLGYEDLCLVLPTHSAASSWEALVKLGFIDHPDGQNMAARWLARQYPGSRLDALPCRGFINQIAMILLPVAQGLGFTVLPRHAVDAFADQQAIRILEPTQPIRDGLWLLRRREWPLSRPAALAEETLRRQLV